MAQVQKTSQVEVVVDAAAHLVWELVVDVTRVGEWSHECRSARWLDGDGRARPGARFRGRNRAGWARWSRTAEIVSVDPPHEIVWRTVPTRIVPDSTLWRIRVDPVEGGTRIRQSFDVVAAPWLLDRFFARVLPAHRDRDARLVEDLRRIGRAASREAAPWTGA